MLCLHAWPGASTIEDENCTDLSDRWLETLADLAGESNHRVFRRMRSFLLPGRGPARR